MKKSLLLLLLLTACNNGPASRNSADGEPACGGAFSNERAKEEDAPEESIVLERSDVQEFRGTEMVKLLQRMDSSDPDDWKFVRRHVHPAPLAPVEWREDGKVRARNFDWPPRTDKEGNLILDDQQRAWRSYLLWPEHIRSLLHKQDWESADNRARLSGYGRMYSLMHDFQTRQPYGAAARESEYWRVFAESMLAYEDDGRELLVANMVVALSSPDEGVVSRAQELLVQIGDPAIETLCAAMWTTHRQGVVAWDERLDPDDPTGIRRIREEVITSVSNPNYNKYIVDTLYQIGPRVVGYAISELELSLDAEGKAVGPGWRFRRYFIELIGKLGRLLSAQMQLDSLTALEREVDRVVVQEYDEAELAKGRRVVDEMATDDARFVFHEYLIQALGELGARDGIRPVIKLWKLDADHEDAAVRAIRNLSNKSVRTLEDAREVAKALKVDLKGE